MGASLIVGPTSEPVTLAEAKTHLRIDSADLDATIASQIIAARFYVEAYTRRALMRQTWDFTYDYRWPCGAQGARIDPDLQPVVSVTSISYVDDAGATQTLAADQYQVVAGADNLARIVPAYDVTWPTVRCQPSAVTVRCVCGYGTSQGDVPEMLRQAILLHVELLHDRDVQSRPLIEAARDSMMDPYRVVRL